MDDEALRIGQVARRAEVAVDTIRYYERLGLLAPAARSPSGYRRFEASIVGRLRFIRHAQELGFTLEEIGELLDLRLESTGACDEVRSRAVERLQRIDRKLRRLERMREALAKLVSACDERAPTAECPLLEALAQGDDDESDR